MAGEGDASSTSLLSISHWKRLIEAKIKKQRNGIHRIRKRGNMVSLKDENEMAQAKIFILLIAIF